MRFARTSILSLLLALSACSLQPYRTTPPASAPGSPSGQGPSVALPPVLTPAEPEIVVSPPAPVPKERPKVVAATLSPASRALVTQAQSQRTRGDLPGATVSLERALRIEPSNPLLWIEMGRLRMDQRNYAQAEAMGRKALSVSVGDSRTQSAAWQLVADSLQARGKNPEAQEASERSRALATNGR